MRRSFEPSFNWDGIALVQTCGSCPEQYDAYRGGAKVGYLRLRHGSFRVEDRQGDIVLQGSPDGDGCFEEYEREKWLIAACRAIKRSLAN